MSGKIRERNRLAEQKTNASFLKAEKRIYGTIAKIKVDPVDGKWTAPFVQVRYELPRGTTSTQLDPVHSGFIGDENTWLPLGNKPSDIVLRFGEPSVGDRVMVIYRHKPEKGKAFLIEDDNEDAYGAGEIGQNSFIIFPPGG